MSPVCTRKRRSKNAKGVIGKQFVAHTGSLLSLVTHICPRKVRVALVNIGVNVVAEDVLVMPSRDRSPCVEVQGELAEEVIECAFADAAVGCVVHPMEQRESLTDSQDHTEQVAGPGRDQRVDGGVVDSNESSEESDEDGDDTLQASLASDGVLASLLEVIPHSLLESVVETGLIRSKRGELIGTNQGAHFIGLEVLPRLLFVENVVHVEKVSAFATSSKKNHGLAAGVLVLELCQIVDLAVNDNPGGLGRVVLRDLLPCELLSLRSWFQGDIQLLGCPRWACGAVCNR
jgi:hypothetical protein